MRVGDVGIGRRSMTMMMITSLPFRDASGAVYLYGNRRGVRGIISNAEFITLISRPMP